MTVMVGPVPWIVGAGFTVAGLVISGVGWTMVGRQHYRLATYQPTAARIIESYVQTIRGDAKHPDTYEPIIHYTYTVSDQLHYGNRVLPMGNYSSSGNWASHVCAQYPPQTQTTAWYSPVDPDSAFLIHEAKWFPHLMALFSCIFLAIGIALLGAAMQGSRSPRPPVADTAGWFRVAEEKSISGRFRLWAIIALLWYAYCITIVADYVTVNHSFGLFGTIALIACCGVGIVPLIMAWCFWRLHHDFLEAQLCISQDQINPGDAIKVRLCQDLLKPLEIEDLSIGAICIRNDRQRFGNKVQYTSTEAWSSWKTVEKNRAYAAGAKMAGQTEIDFPTGAHPSGASQSEKYPYFQWFLALRIKTQGQPKLNVRFPIVVGVSHSPRASGG
jgi:hypothetical protein